LRLSNLVHLYRVRLRSRRVQELLALVGIAVGVALLFAASVANTSLTGSVEQLTSGIVGQTRFQLAARGPDGFTERLLGAVERIPGVRAAAPVLEVRANVVGPRGRQPVELVGGDPRFARLGGALLHQFTSEQLARQRAIALPSPIAEKIGVSLTQPVTLEIGASIVTAPLGAQLHAEDIGDLVRSPVALAPLAFAQDLTGLNGKVTRIFVQPAAGKEARVEEALNRIADGRLNVRPARFDAHLFEEAAAPSSNSTGLFSAFSALVGFVFAFSAMLLTVPMRRDLIADLRLEGYGPGVVIEVLLFDALILGLAASAAGLLLGDQISRHLFKVDPGYLAYTFPVGSQRIVSAQGVALALGGGLLASGVAVLSPVREIFKRRSRAHRSGGASGNRAVWQAATGVTALAATTLIVVLAPELALIGMASLTAALLLLLAPAIDTLLQGVKWLTQWTKTSAPVLVSMALSSRANHARALAVAATGAIAVLSSVAIEGARYNLQRGLDSSARHVDSIADLWITPRGQTNTFATTAFHAGAMRELSRLAGVRAARIYRGGFLDWDDRRVWVLGPPRDAALPIPPSQITQADLARARVGLRRGGWLVLSHALADEHHLRVGDAVTLPTPVPTTLRVAALSSNLGWPPGAVILNADDYAHAWGNADPSAYQLMLRPDAEPAVVRAEVERTLGPRSALNVETAQEREQRHYASTRQALSRLMQIRTLVLIAAVLAMATAMAGMIWQRRPRLASLKVDGFSAIGVWRALVLESAVVLGAACFLGAVFGLYGQLLLSRALATITGFPLVFSVGALVAIGMFALVTLVAVAMIAVPGYLASRVPAAMTLQD
jgi:putative ABC transport system permease protein